MTTQYELNAEWQAISLNAGSFEIVSASGLPFEISENADKSAPVSGQNIGIKADGAKTIYLRSFSKNIITISNFFFADSALAFSSGGGGNTGSTKGSPSNAALIARLNTLEAKATENENTIITLATGSARYGQEITRLRLTLNALTKEMASLQAKVQKLENK